mgnify:CR=1 FL=1
MNSIETKNINIAYGNVNIVEDLNLEIPKGKITTIIGANGCGKSTILKTIARILKAKSGDIYINSKNINEQSSKEIARNMAVLPQSPQAPGGLTVEELIAYGRFPHQSGFKNNKQEDKEIVDWALKATGISEFRDRKIEDLSGGQRQRAWIAMALAQQTDILLLDEPTTYLDIAYQVEILDLLTDLNRKRGTTIVMVLHDINLSARYADYIFALRKGKLVSQGSPEDIITSELINDVFGLDCEVIKDPVSYSPFIIPKGRHYVNV